MRESNPRLPARQAGTLAAELTRHWRRSQGSNPQPAACKAAALPKLSYTPPTRSIRARVPAPPNRRGRFPPTKRKLDEGSCPGVACGSRTRVTGLKSRSPGPARRTRPIDLVPPASDRTRDLPLTRRLLCQLSYGGGGESTSAVSTRERPVGRGVSLHVAWPGSRTSRPPTPYCAAAECMGTPEVERMTSFELVASTMAWSRSAC